MTADAKSKIYGDADPALTYQITSGSLAFSDSFTGALTRVAGEDVGTYAIKQGTLALSSNYNLTYVGANLTITQRPITVTADAKSKVYGDADPALTYQITSGSLAFSDAFTGALSREAGENVGNLRHQAGDAGSLQQLQPDLYRGEPDASAQRPITVTADAKSKVYGDCRSGADLPDHHRVTRGHRRLHGSAIHEQPARTSAARAIQQGTLPSSANYTLTYIGANLTISPAADLGDGGRQEQDLRRRRSGAHLSDHQRLPRGQRQLHRQPHPRGRRECGQLLPFSRGRYPRFATTISPIPAPTSPSSQRPISVTADAKSKTYGDADPALTYQITSGALVGSDSFSGALTRDAGENVGSYAINQGTPGAAAATTT